MGQKTSSYSHLPLGSLEFPLINLTQGSRVLRRHSGNWISHGGVWVLSFFQKLPLTYASLYPPHSTACTAKGNGHPLLLNKIKWNQIKALLKHLVHPEYRRFLPDSKEWWRVKLSRMKMVFLLLKGIFILKVCKAYLFRCLWQYVCMCMRSYIPQRN